MPKKAISSTTLDEQRDKLFDRLLHGKVTPQAAEEEAAKLGCGPLAHSPPPEHFDPMQQPHWTLLMALAWVISRNPGEVRSVNNDYLAECFEFRGKRHKGHLIWELAKPRPASFFMLENMTLENEGAFDTAKRELWAALETGKINSIGVRSNDGQTVDVPTREWLRLETSENHDHTDYFHFRGNHFARVYSRYSSILLPRDEILAMWPVPTVQPRRGTSKDAAEFQAWARAFTEGDNGNPPSPDDTYKNFAKPRGLNRNWVRIHYEALPPELRRKRGEKRRR